MTDTLSDFLEWVRHRVHARFEAVLAEQSSPYSRASEPQLARLIEAVNYSVSNGGKRLRPALVYAAAQAVQSDLSESQLADLDCVALAVECIHSYSLVHDDLPAMDDDDLRRGKPTCHIAYDEATAILVGDGLQALAFELITQTGLSAETQIQMIRVLAQAAGNCGMVGGQALDLASENRDIALAELELLHRLKTGAMIRASVAVGAIAVGASMPQQALLDRYADAIGLAFQVQDDVLDIQSDTETLGKPQGADLRLNKATYPALLGLQGAIDKAEALVSDAKQVLAELPEPADQLARIADYIITRNH